MKLLVSIALVVCICALTMAAPDKEYYDLEKAPEIFEKFIKDFNRVYNDDADKQVHFEAFKKNLEKINQQNKDSKTATFGINKFADYTEDERKNMFGFKRT
ncbi:hypothetical protein ABMA27_014779 [Loxostege sticticalis]|uniref:Cathepsin propeptide inhibitor domain-containing protein n=1 Tax=Loxostege sticticalis TaxID=481309 RepID=A0ABR3IA60_LOXSC